MLALFHGIVGVRGSNPLGSTNLLQAVLQKSNRAEPKFRAAWRGVG